MVHSHITHLVAYRAKLSIILILLRITIIIAWQCNGSDLHENGKGRILAIHVILQGFYDCKYTVPSRKDNKKALLTPHTTSLRSFRKARKPPTHPQPNLTPLVLQKGPASQSAKATEKRGPIKARSLIHKKMDKNDMTISWHNQNAVYTPCFLTRP